MMRVLIAAGAALLAVAAGAIAAPAVLDQLVHEQQGLENHWNTDYEHHVFGVATAISPDGNVLVVGDTAALIWGAAYVFERGAGGWVFRERLTTDRGDLFTEYGFAVAASNDTIVVGAPGQIDDAKNSATGYAYVYVRTADGWTLQQELEASDASGYGFLDEFGSSVAIEGDRILVGAIDAPSHAGAAYAFERTAGTWDETQILTAPDALYGAEYGFTVAMDGGQAVVAAIAWGTAYIYVHNGSSWLLEQQLAPDGDERWNGFGWALSLRGDRLLVSAPFFGNGVVLVYERLDGAWTYVQSLSSDAIGMFGSALAQTADRLVVGAADFQGVSGGRAFVYGPGDGGWTLGPTIAPADISAGDRFGWALAAAGGQLAIAAIWANTDNAPNAGSVRMYDGVDGSPASQVLTVNDGAPDSSFGSGAALDGDFMVLGAPGIDHDGLANAGAAFIYSRGPDGWTLHQELPGPCSLGRFGTQVAMDAGTIVITGSCNAYTTNVVRHAYVFVREGDLWVQQAVLEFDDLWGYGGIALQGDTLLVGEPDERVDSIETGGGVHVYQRTGDEWQKTTTLHASGAYHVDDFGAAVDISGNRILVGAPGSSTSTIYSQGTAYLFANEGAGWVEQRRIVAPDATNYDHFGSSVAFAGDQLAIGAVGDMSYRGSVYIFDVTGGGITQAQKLLAADGKAADDFGHRVAVDGDVLVVASPLQRVGHAFAGSGYVYVKGSDGWTFRTRLAASDGYVDDQLASAIDIDGERILLSAPRAGGINGAGAGKAYVFEGLPPPLAVPPAPEPEPEVTAPAPAGGGGALSPLMLLVLLVAARGGRSRREARRDSRFTRRIVAASPAGEAHVVSLARRTIALNCSKLL